MTDADERHIWAEKQMGSAGRQLIIDGLVISEWSRSVFEDMRAGGLTAANCTCSIWEGFEATMRNVAAWKALFRDNADIILQVYDISDIRRALDEGRVGIILGWQNSTGFGDYLPFVRLFHELGIRVVQLTYNTANAAGSGCYKSWDNGLTDFGRELVHELNDAGILVDLSHVGGKTSRDVIDVSKRPVAYSHCCPATLRRHPRNKTDEDLRYIVDRGGFVGVAGVPPFLPKGLESTVDDFVDAVAHVLDVVGEDCVGIGTDLIQNQPPEFFDWIASDKGYGRQLVDLGGLPVLGGFERASDYGNIVDAMRRKGFSSDLSDKVLGRNWLSFLERVWG